MAGGSQPAETWLGQTMHFLKEQAGPLQEEKTQAATKAKLKKQDLRGKQDRATDLSNQSTKCLDRIENSRDKIDDHKNAIADAKKRVERFYKKKTEKQKELAEKEQILHQMQGRDEAEDKRQLQEAKAENTQISGQIRDNQSEIQRIKGEVTDLHHEVKKTAFHIQKLESFKDQAMKKLIQSNRNVEVPMEWLRENQDDQFHEKVFEPICLQVEVIDTRDAPLVETFIPRRDMSAFLAQTKDDHEQLTKKASAEKWKINIVKDPNEERSPKFSMKDLERYGFKTVVSQLFNAPEPVMRYLNHTYNLSQIPVGPANNRASDIANEMYQEFGISVCVFGDVSTTVRQSSHGQKNLFSKESNVKNRADLLGASVDQSQVKKLKAQKNEYEAQYEEYERQQKELTDKEKAMRKQEAGLRNKIDKLKNKVKAAKEAERGVVRLKKSIEDVDAEIVEKEAEVRTHSKKLSSAVEKYVREVLQLKAATSKAVRGKAARDSGLYTTVYCHQRPCPCAHDYTSTQPSTHLNETGPSQNADITANNVLVSYLPPGRVHDCSRA